MVGLWFGSLVELVCFDVFGVWLLFGIWYFLLVVVWCLMFAAGCCCMTVVLSWVWFARYVMALRVFGFVCVL